MNRQKLTLVIGILNTLTLCFAALIFILPKTRADTPFLRPIPKSYEEVKSNNILGAAVYAAASFKEIEKPVKPVNILLLGLDGRKGEKKPRCDAIHLISVDIAKGKIQINSVPRGTGVEIPNTAKQLSYLANSCSIMGIDFAKEQVEKITGIKADYTVKIGFSQTLGIFRTIGLPTTSTLQFLRNRRYKIGDNQRSYNQANFIKTMGIAHLHDYYKLPKPIKYLVYKMTDTDLDFETADNLISQILESGMLNNKDNIEVKIYLPKKVKVREIDYTPKEENKNDDKEFQLYQQGLETYLNNLINKGDNFLSTGRQASLYQLVKTPFVQKLWLQIEDEEKRDLYNYDLLRLYALSAPDKEEVNSMILDFITQMEMEDQPVFKEKGEKLLNITSQT